MNRILALLAFITLCGFLGILLANVLRWDLGVVIFFTLLLAAYDLWSSSGRKPNADK